jgi:hypothetical protein
MVPERHYERETALSRVGAWRPISHVRSPRLQQRRGGAMWRKELARSVPDYGAGRRGVTYHSGIRARLVDMGWSAVNPVADVF